ncbi:MAG TPA: hypothetical protein VHR66_10525 [Gemmataceae bacterium]|jgi:hypothetical protein|nr:hypothetical protein [Gemmataceae bacterium]
MRPLLSLAAGLLLTAIAAGQDVAPRFEILHNPDLYLQETPQQTLASVIIAVGRERYDYLAAHLLDPAMIDARLATNQAYFERVSGEQIVSTAAGAALRPADLEIRVREVATRANFQNLTAQIGRKMVDEPDNFRDLKRFAREGQFQVAGETATVTIKDVKDKALYFKKVGNRWFMDNRKEDAAPSPPPMKE